MGWGWVEKERETFPALMQEMGAKTPGSSFLIQFAKCCALTGELSLLTFSVNIHRYVMIPAI
jgi:hypothetical protein